MGFESLRCPHCGCSVEPRESNAGIIRCSRCNEVFQLESDCSGSCMSCGHATKKDPCGFALDTTGLAGFSPGELVTCTIGLPDADGYHVAVGPQKLPGFMATDKTFTEAAQVSAIVVCVHKDRLLLSSALRPDSLQTSTTEFNETCPDESRQHRLKALLQRLFHV